MYDWERSFPAPQIQGHSWIVNVLEDLEAYCEYNGLVALQQELSEVLLRLEDENDPEFYAHGRAKRKLDS